MLDRRVRLALTACAFLSAAAPAFAGTVITGDTIGPVLSNGKSVFYLEPDRMRLETGRGVVIFRADQSTAYMLNPVEKKFTRLTADRLAQLAQRADPSGQRAPAAYEFRRTGGTARYGTWSCEEVEQLTGGQPIAILCVAPLAAIGLSQDDLGAFRRFESFMRQGVPQAAGSPLGIDPQALEKAVGYSGFAVHARQLDSGVETTTLSVEKKSLAAELFEVPPGYEEQPLPSLPPLH